jgi:hypothetical protein
MEEDELKVVDGAREKAGGMEKLCEGVEEVEKVAQTVKEGGHGGLDCQTWQLWGKMDDPPTGGGSGAVGNS